MLKWPQKRPGAVFFSTNPDLVDILGDTDLDFDDFHFWDFFDPICLDFKIPGFPDSRLLSSYRSKGPCDVFDPWVRWERGQVGI